MPKKITKQLRRKMLADHEEGATFPELKEKFGIKDTRTLQRNLEIAEREREQREVRVHIYTDSQQLHLAQIRELAENWRHSTKVNFPSGDFGLGVEDDDLFSGLKEHFPHSNLWAKYEVWKDKAGSYRRLWHDLAEKGEDKAERDTGLKGPVGMTEGLAASFVPSALSYAMDLRDKCMAEAEKKTPTELAGEVFIPVTEELYKKRKIMASCPCALEFIPTNGDIAWGTEKSVSKCIEVHYKMVKEFWASPRVIELVSLRMSLAEVQSQIDRVLRLNLLKQSYIRYTCEFCPLRELRAEET